MPELARPSLMRRWRHLRTRGRAPRVGQIWMVYDRYYAVVHTPVDDDDEVVVMHRRTERFTHAEWRCLLMDGVGYLERP